MNIATLSETCDRISQAACPEDLFGASEQERAYYRLAALIHPDKFSIENERVIAEQGFKLLQQYWVEAKGRLLDGSYGDRRRFGKAKFSTVTISLRDRELHLTGVLSEGDLSTLYWVGDEQRQVLKIAKDATNNDLLQGEAKNVRLLWQDDSLARFRPLVPKLLTSFRYRGESGESPRQANLLEFATGPLYSLKAVHDRNGDLDPRDMAWIFRRLLLAVGLAHRVGVVHGAVTPEHVLIQPEEHGLVLVDWAYSCPSQETIRAIVPTYEAWYPMEVFAREGATSATDIYMVAGAMNYMLSGSCATAPSTPIAQFLLGCRPTVAHRRPYDAFALLGEFDEFIERLWGPRKFRPFSLKSKGVA